MVGEPRRPKRGRRVVSEYQAIVAKGGYVPEESFLNDVTVNSISDTSIEQPKLSMDRLREMRESRQREEREANLRLPHDHNAPLPPIRVTWNKVETSDSESDSSQVFADENVASTTPVPQKNETTPIATQRDRGVARVNDSGTRNREVKQAQRPVPIPRVQRDIRHSTPKIIRPRKNSFGFPDLSMIRHNSSEEASKSPRTSTAEFPIDTRKRGPVEPTTVVLNGPVVDLRNGTFTVPTSPIATQNGPIGGDGTFTVPNTVAHDGTFTVATAKEGTFTVAPNDTVPSTDGTYTVANKPPIPPNSLTADQNGSTEGGGTFTVANAVAQDAPNDTVPGTNGTYTVANEPSIRPQRQSIHDVSMKSASQSPQRRPNVPTRRSIRDVTMKTIADNTNHQDEALNVSQEVEDVEMESLISTPAPIDRRLNRAGKRPSLEHPITDVSSPTSINIAHRMSDSRQSMIRRKSTLIGSINGITVPGRVSTGSSIEYDNGSIRDIDTSEDSSMGMIDAVTPTRTPNTRELLRKSVMLKQQREAQKVLTPQIFEEEDENEDMEEEELQGGRRNNIIQRNITPSTPVTSNNRSQRAHPTTSTPLSARAKAVTDRLSIPSKHQRGECEKFKKPLEPPSMNTTRSRGGYGYTPEPSIDRSQLEDVNGKSGLVPRLKNKWIKRKTKLLFDDDDDKNGHNRDEKIRMKMMNRRDSMIVEDNGTGASQPTSQKILDIFDETTDDMERSRRNRNDDINQLIKSTSEISMDEDDNGSIPNASSIPSTNHTSIHSISCHDHQPMSSPVNNGNQINNMSTPPVRQRSPPYVDSPFFTPRVPVRQPPGSPMNIMATPSPVRQRAQPYVDSPFFTPRVPIRQNSIPPSPMATVKTPFTRMKEDESELFSTETPGIESSRRHRIIHSFDTTDDDDDNGINNDTQQQPWMDQSTASDENEASQRDDISQIEISQEETDARLLVPRKLIAPTASPDVRRSTRTRMKPVRSWLGEQPIYERDDKGNLCLTGVNEVLIKDKLFVKTGVADIKVAIEKKKRGAQQRRIAAQKRKAAKKANASDSDSE